MLSMMDHITRRLDKLDSKNDDIKTEKKEPKLRFDKKVQKCQGDFVICGDIYQRKRARSCHILSHRVTNRPLTLGKAYEVSSIIRTIDERTGPMTDQRSAHQKLGVQSFNLILDKRRRFRFIRSCIT